MKSKVLNIASILGTDIRVRSRIYEVVNCMDESSDYIFDLSGVEFISRSFADELISMVEKSDRSIQLINTNPDITALLRIVKAGRSVRRPDTGSICIHNLADMKEVEMFFCK